MAEITVNLRSQGGSFQAIQSISLTQFLCKQVKYFAGRLLELLKADGLAPTPESEAEYQIAQFDAIFSIGTRRNEVWTVLKDHPWRE